MTSSTQLKKINSVLLIDDDPISHSISEAIFLNLNICNNLYTFPNAIQGLNYFNSIRSIGEIPELVLVDLKMPILNGFDFLLAFERSFKQYRNRVKIIVLTSSTKSEDKEIAFQFGFDDYIEKPLSHNKIREVLIKHFPEDLSKMA